MYLQKMQQKYFLMQTIVLCLNCVWMNKAAMHRSFGLCNDGRGLWWWFSITHHALGQWPIWAPPSLQGVCSKYTVKSRSCWINTLLHTQAHTFHYYTYHTVSTRGIIPPWHFLCGHLTWFSSSPCSHLSPSHSLFPSVWP